MNATTTDLSSTPGITTDTTASTQAISSTSDNTRRFIKVMHLVSEHARNASSPTSPELRQLHDVPRLPGDVVALILEYLQIPDLSQTKLVCRDWRDLSDSEQWRHMELAAYQIQCRPLNGLLKSRRESRITDSDVPQAHWKPTFTLAVKFDFDTNRLEQIMQLLVGVKELRLGSGLSHGEHEEDRAKIFLLPGLKGKLLKISNIPVLLLNSSLNRLATFGTWS